MWNTAFRFMIFDKAKLIGILFGIIISVFLIGAQLGLLDGLLDSSLGVLKDNEQYLYVVNAKSTSSASLLNVDKRVGYELQSIAGVEKVYPVVVSGGTVKYPSGGTNPAVIVGVQTPDYVGSPLGYLPNTNLQDLQNEGAVIVDNGDVENMGNIKVGEFFAINEMRVYISGISINNTGLGQQNIITSIERARKLSGFSANHVSAFLVKTSSKDLAAQQQIAQSINQTIPTIKAYAGVDFLKFSLDYIKTASGIMTSFMILVGFALVTGLIIVGLTMFSAVNDRIRDYGTIKAIGGGNGLIAQLIMAQAALYAFIGFAFAMTLLYGLQYAMMAANQAMYFTPSLIAFLVFSTLIISLVGSYFSMRKILKLEPVQIFRM